MARHNDEELTKKWNTLIGNRTGKPVKPRSAKSNYTASVDSVRQGAKSTSARMASGTSKVPADVKKAYARQFGKQAVGGGKSAVSSFQKTMNNVVEDTVKELQTQIDTENAVMRAMENPAPQQQDPGIWDGIVDLVTKKGPLGFIGGNGDENWGPTAEERNQGTSAWQGLMEDFTRSPVGRGLDIISRPAYGVAEGMQSALEAGYGTDGEGGPDDLWHSFDDLGAGFARGVSGQEKTGFGDVWRTMRDNSEIAGMDELRQLDESHPGYTRWLDRGVGLAGEITMDPLNYAGGAAVPIVRGTGEQLVESTARSAARSAVETTARDFYDDVVATLGKSRWRPNQDSFAIQAMNAAESAAEKNLLEISGGGHTGWSKMGGKTLPTSTANQVTESVRTELFRGFDRNVDAAISALDRSGNLPINSWRTRLGRDPEFEELVDNLWNELDAKGRQYPTRDAMLKDLTKNDIPLIKKLAEPIRQKFDGDLSELVYNRVVEDVENLYYNTVGLRVGNKVIPSKTIGKAYSAVKKNLPESLKTKGDDFAAAMSYERSFPGRLSLMTQHNRSVGVKVAEEFRDKWRNIAKNFTQEQAAILQKAIEDGTVLTGDMEKMRQMLKREYRGMFYEEVNRGARSPGSKMADNYAFVYTKGGRKADRSEFKTGRKDWVGENGNVGRFTTEDAKARGLHPTENAFEALLARKLKSIRDNTRAMFLKDLLDNYGIMAKPVGSLGLEKRGLVEFGRNELPNAMKNMYDKGERFYLPKEMAKTFETYKNLSGWNPADSGSIVRNMSKITGWIKYLSTVPRPGFHIRNMIGDYYMGLLDDIPTRLYEEVARKWSLNRAGKKVSFRISKNYTESWEKMWEMYERHANSGFFDVEIPMGGDVPTAGQRVGNSRKRAANWVREASDNREDYGRFVHFVGAYRQEVNGLLNKGMKDMTRIQEKAVEAATWRVNGYKFDYSALTGLERRAKLLFPFYTFQRKAAPALLESMFLNPQFMSLPNRFMEYNDGSAQDNFNKYFLPPYAKDLGYAFLNNEDEPLYMTGDILPTSALNNIDTTNSQEFFQSVGQQMNPLAQIIPEMALGKQIFSQRPTGSFPEYLMNKFSVPGQFVSQAGDNANTPDWLERLNESWTGAGIPVRQFTDAQQDFGLREAEDRFIQDPFSNFNRQQNGFRVYQSNRADGTSFRVENTSTGEVIFETMNPSEAIAAAKRLSGS